MKYFLSSVLLCLVVSANAQTQLSTGVYVRDTLLSFSWSAYPQPNNCYGWEINWGPNILPYVTGMNMYLHFDSITCPVGCISDSVNLVPGQNAVVPGDSILILNSQQNIYFFFQTHDTVYVSVIVEGTPQITLENYFCHYSKFFMLTSDGCGNIVHQVNGGNGPFDTNKYCAVDAGMDIEENDSASEPLIYPNPASGLIRSRCSGLLTIYDMTGRVVFDENIEPATDIYLPTLESGIYYMEIVNDSGEFRDRLILE